MRVDATACLYPNLLEYEPAGGVSRARRGYVSELQQAVEEHVNEEEREVFPKMESELGTSRLEEIGAEVESEKSR
jgi:hypothetical protein